MRVISFNLGCGLEPRPGCFNVDQRGPAADVLMDGKALALRADVLPHLEALHLVEHLGYVGTAFALAEWYRVLKPSGTLVLETPDFPQTARRFLRSGGPGRAMLSNWIFGLESPGMGHLFGFEPDLLSALVAEAGFGEIRVSEPRTHRTLPGFRIVCRKKADPRLMARAAFLSGITVLGKASDQAIGQEMLKEHAPLMSKACEGQRAAAQVLALLTAVDPQVGRAALKALSAHVSSQLRSRWGLIIERAERVTLPRLLVERLLEKQARPGQMEATYKELLSRAMTEVSEMTFEPATVQTKEQLPSFVGPFSPAGLTRESEHQIGIGLRNFVRNHHEPARRHLEIATKLNSNNAAAFWNLSRLAQADNRKELAITELSRAELAGQKVGKAEVVCAIRDERAQVERGVLSSGPVSLTGND